MCDAVARQQQSEKRCKHVGFYGPCAARRNEAGGSMGLARWVLPGATTSHVRRGEYNNNEINSS